MKKSNFSDVLDAAGSLCIDEQEALVKLLQKRTIEERRCMLAQEIKTAEADFKNRKFSNLILI